MAIRIFTEEDYATYFPDTLFSGLTTYITTQYQIIKEFYTVNPRSCIHIGESDHLEWKISSLLGGEWVGRGNEAVDVAYNKTSPDGTVHKIGIDVKSVNIGSLRGKCTNETSLIQDFKKGGSSLENDLEEKRIDKIRSDWLGQLMVKLNHTKEKHELEEIIYVFLMPSIKNVKLVAFHLDIEKIEKATSSTSTRSPKSVKINNLIDDRYGNTKIYASKKRLELRLHHKAIEPVKLLFSKDDVENEDETVPKDSSDKSAET